MTVPVPSGYPDFGRYQAQATKIYAQQFGVVSGVEVDVNLGYVGDVPYLGVSLFASVGNFQAEIAFYNDAAHTTRILSHFIGMRVNDSFTRTMPVLGPYAQLIITPSGGAATFDYQLVQAVTAYQVADFGSDANILFSRRASAIAVGTTSDEAAMVWPGEANLYVILPAVAAEVRVNAVREDGTVTFLGGVVGNGITAERRIFLPYQHIQMQLINPGPGAQTFTAVLTAEVAR